MRAYQAYELLVKAHGAGVVVNRCWWGSICGEIQLWVMSGTFSQNASMPLCSRSRHSVDLLSTLLDALACLQNLRGSSNGLCTNNTQSP